jgi:hypothetical protein
MSQSRKSAPCARKRVDEATRRRAQGFRVRIAIVG